jgi:hypothetical protein
MELTQRKKPPEWVRARANLAVRVARQARFVVEFAASRFCDFDLVAYDK